MAIAAASSVTSVMTESFTKLDTNWDGVESEIAEVLTPEQFAAIEVNRDDRASRNEFMNEIMRGFHCG